MDRSAAIQKAADYLHSGRFLADLDRHVGFRTESVFGKLENLAPYLADDLVPALDQMGFSSEICRAKADGRNLFLIAERHEDAALPTVLMYGHGDVVAGMDDRWSDGLTPWRVTQRGDRLYGRGTADNKGQHAINLGAFAEVLKARNGRIGFNMKLLLEMGEEIGSPELTGICRSLRDRLKADVMISSDGPRMAAERPTLFLGARGIFKFRLTADLRPGDHHSGNWGGLLVNPATLLANAIGRLCARRPCPKRCGRLCPTSPWCQAPMNLPLMWIGGNRASPPPSASMAGMPWRCSLSPPATRNGRSMRFRARPRRSASFASWSEPTWMGPRMRSAATWRQRASPRWP
jgi:acetylornithine deacetylase/succinyl-diaminopimelate desuccinylase-like protein